MINKSQPRLYSSVSLNICPKSDAGCDPRLYVSMVPFSEQNKEISPDPGQKLTNLNYRSGFEQKENQFQAKDDDTYPEEILETIEKERKLNESLACEYQLSTDHEETLQPPHSGHSNRLKNWRIFSKK